MSVQSDVELCLGSGGRRPVVLVKRQGEPDYSLGRFDLASPRARAKLVTELRKVVPRLEEVHAADKVEALALLSIRDAKAARRAPSAHAGGEAGAPVGLTLTDSGNAERLVHAHGARVRYCHPWGKWLVWDRGRWRVDERGQVMALTKSVARDLHREALSIQDDRARGQAREWALKSERCDRRRAMAELARSEPGVAVSIAELDRDPWLLNCKNATLDLRTGQAKEHSPLDLITKRCPTEFHSKAPHPRWTAFLERVLPDDDVRAYFQRFCGYGLTGEVGEQVLLIAVGDGANGKSTAFRVIQEVLSRSYAIQISADLLTVRSQRSHPTDVADLFGVRLAIGAETSKQQELDVAFVKQLTGGDRLRARRMREDFWEFAPTHKLVLITNHLPRIPTDDYAMLRRLHRLQFEVTIPTQQRNKSLLRELREEREGVLAWMVEGCRMWREQGLNPPDQVLIPMPAQQPEPATVFIAQCVVPKPGGRVGASELFEAFQPWCEPRGYASCTQTEFGRAMGRAGFGRRKIHGNSVYLDVELRRGSAGAGGHLGTVGDPACVQPAYQPHERSNSDAVPKYPQVSPGRSGGSPSAPLSEDPCAIGGDR